MSTRPYHFFSKRLIAFFALCTIGAAGGCSTESKLTSNSDLSGGLWSMSVSSPAFNSDEMIPAKYSADGGNVSPPLTWSGGPSGTKEFILVVQDPDAPGDYPYLHWFVYRIPATMTSLPEGASKSNPNLMQGKNYLGKAEYAGPKPPPGKQHRYFFQVFAVDTPEDFGKEAELSAAMGHFKGHVLSKGILVGRYKSER